MQYKLIKNLQMETKLYRFVTHTSSDLTYVLSQFMAQILNYIHNFCIMWHTRLMAKILHFGIPSISFPTEDNGGL
jgi:hypothetical protein